MTVEIKENRKDRFIRVASKRTDEIIDKLRILGNCSNKSSYDYTDDQVNKIFSTITKEMLEAKAKFKKGKRERFKL